MTQVITPTDAHPAQVTASDIARMIEVNGIDPTEVAYESWLVRVDRYVRAACGVPLECGEDVDTRALYESYPDNAVDAGKEVLEMWGTYSYEW